MVKKDFPYRPDVLRNHQDELGETFFPPVEQGIEKGPELPAVPLEKIEQPEQPIAPPQETTPTELPPAIPETPVPVEQPEAQPQAETSPQDLIAKGLKEVDNNNPFQAVEDLEQGQQGDKHE